MTKQVRVSLVGAAAVAALVAVTLPLRASETIDYDGINKIKRRASARRPRRSWRS